MALTFSESRASGTYEARAEGIANDLADGQTPKQVRKFRASLLELRPDPKLASKLFDRKDRLYGAIIPGYDAKPSSGAGAVYFAIGPDEQLDAWDQYLRTTAAKGSRLYKLYGRDFWML